MALHQTMAANGTYTCANCDRVFANVVALNTHSNQWCTGNNLQLFRIAERAKRNHSHHDDGTDFVTNGLSKRRPTYVPLPPKKKKKKTNKRGKKKKGDADPGGSNSALSDSSDDSSSEDYHSDSSDSHIFEWDSYKLGEALPEKEPEVEPKKDDTMEALKEDWEDYGNGGCEDNDEDGEVQTRQKDSSHDHGKVGTAHGKVGTASPRGQSSESEDAVPISVKRDYHQDGFMPAEATVPNPANTQTCTNPRARPSEDAEMPFRKGEINLTKSYQFQVELMDIIGRRRVDLQLYDDIVKHLKKHSEGSELNFSSEELLCRSRMLSQLEKIFGTTSLKATDVEVPLHHGGTTTVPVFDLEAQILSLLMDEELMKPENLAPGYDIFTGKVTENPTEYSEVHTGRAWEPARKHYCGDVSSNMPIALIVFGDSSHYGNNGTLKTMPLIFTLSCFNQEARKKVDFWRPMAYIPNLSYGLTESNPLYTAEKRVQDEHNCLQAALRPLREIHESGGIAFKFRGKAVIGKVWIHFFIGDTEGFNKWAGQKPGSNAMGYRDCCCCRGLFSKVRLQCKYYTRELYRQMKDEMLNASNKTAFDQVQKDWSMYYIHNAFVDDNVPLSDIIHGVWRMLPPELLHTTQEGITKYMLYSLGHMIDDAGQLMGETKVDTKKVKSALERLHAKVHVALKRNSERDLPRGTERVGFLKEVDQKVKAHERRGNLARLVILCHTETGRDLLLPYLWELEIDFDDFIECIKLYLAMEEWFHTNNSITEVDNSTEMVEFVMERITTSFPRTVGKGYDVEKFHGLAKMRVYIQLYGCGINFFGGPGETSHKKFVKDMACNTQMRIGEFTSQIAKRYYESLLRDRVSEYLRVQDERDFELVGAKKKEDFVLENEFQLAISVFDKNKYSVDATKWTTRNLQKGTVLFDEYLALGISNFYHSLGHSGKVAVKCYTCCKLELEGKRTILRCAEKLGGDDDDWFDFCITEYIDPEKRGLARLHYYPGKILGFFKCVTPFSDIDRHTVYACIQSSSVPMSIADLENHFIRRFDLNLSVSGVTVVPVKQCVKSPLAVVPNFGGKSNQFLAVLPQRRWPQYFSRRIKKKRGDAKKTQKLT